MTRSRWVWVAIIVVVAAGTWCIPVPPGIPADAAPETRIFAALVAAAISALVAFPLGIERPALQWWWPAAALVIGAGAYIWHDSVRRQCVSYYLGKPTVIGTELLSYAAEYKRVHNYEESDDLLFDAGGAPQKVWTQASIARCESLLKNTYFIWAPLCASALAMLVAATITRTPFYVRSRRAGPIETLGPQTPFRYDVFVSYRHGGEDTRFARFILGELERSGFAVAIDERDFRANENFLEEMERCVRESRFIAAVVSRRYFESDNATTEAVISKTMDMADRRRRLIPLVIEPVTMPAWMYSIVGIDFTKDDPLSDPTEKLKATLRRRETAAGSASTIL